MTRSPHLFFDLLDLAAAIRSDGTSARFVAVTADGGRMRCAVTTGSDRPPDAAPEPYRARHPLHGAALQEAAAEFARELVTRRFGALQELGGKGLVTIDASGAVRLDLETRTGMTVREPVSLDRLRQAAISHPTHRAACLAALLSDDTRFPAWSQSERSQRHWMRAAREIDPQGGPDQAGLVRAAAELRRAFIPNGADLAYLTGLIRDRLYPDLAAPAPAPAPAPDRPDGLGTAPVWLPLDPLEAERLHAALGASSDPVLSNVLAKLRTCLSDVSADEAFRAAAVEKYAGRLDEGDLDFQPDGMVSRGDEGAYVQAFLWVSNAEAGLEEPEEDPAP